MSAARKRKKAAKYPRASYFGAATMARYDRRFDQLDAAGQFRDVVGHQAPVKYNRCKHCGYRQHCPPELVDMHVRLDAERKARESEPE